MAKTQDPSESLLRRALRFARRRWGRLLFAGLLSFTILAAGGFYIVVRTEWFQQQIRRNVVEQIGRAVGGRVEIGSYEFSPSSLTVQIHDLSVRAAEDSGEPFLFVPTLSFAIRVDSLLGRKVTLESATLRSPVFRVFIGQDGSTNLPQPGGPAAPDFSAMADLLDLAVESFEVEQGRLVWNGVPYDFSFSADDFDIRTRREESEGRYRASVDVGSWSIAIGDRPPIVAEAHAEFAIYRDRIEVEQIELRRGDDFLRAKGTVRNLAQPSAELSYKARLSAAGWNDWMENAKFVGGEAVTEGVLRWASASDEISYDGVLKANDIEWRFADASPPPISFQTNYVGDRDRLSLNDWELSVLDGVLIGEAVVEPLSSSAPPRFRFRGDFDSISLDSLLGLGAWESGAAGLRRWDSSLHGWLRAEGGSWADLELSLSAVLDSSASNTGMRTPLDGVVDVIYDGAAETFELSRLELSTPYSNVRVTGRMGADGRSALSAWVELVTLDDAAALAQMAGLGFEDSTLSLRGGATIEGEIRGRILLDQPSSPRFDGVLRANDLSLLNYAWDRLEARLEIGPSRLRISQGRLTDPTGSAELSLDLSPQAGSFGPTTPLKGDLAFDRLALEKILRASGRGEPISGLLSGRIALQGTLSSPRGEAEIEATSIELWGGTLDRVRGSLRFDDRIAELQSLEAFHGTSRVEADVRYNRRDRDFQFKIVAPEWRLAGLDALASLQTPSEAHLELALSGAGKLGRSPQTFEALNLSGDWSIRGRSGQRRRRLMWGEIRNADEDVVLDWHAELLSGRADGVVRLAASRPISYSGNLEFSKLSLVDLARWRGVEITRAVGEVDGKLEFSGAFREPKSLAAEGVFSRLEVGLAEIPGARRGYKVWNPFPMRFALRDGALHLDHVRLHGDGTDVEFNGTLGYLDDRTLDCSVEGIFNLAVIESFRSDLTASGSSTLELTMGGTLDEPELVGTMGIQDAALRSEDFANGLNQVNGKVTFTGERLRIENLTASTGGGRLRLTGNAAFGDGPVSYRLEMFAERIRLRYPASISNVFDGRLTYSGSGLQSLLSGEVVISRASIAQAMDLGTILASLGEPQQTLPSNPVLRDMQLNVTVRSVPDLRIDTPMIRNLRTAIDLRLSGTPVHPSLLGRADVTQGVIRFQGSRYQIIRGDITFTNPFRVDPVVNFELETRIGDVDVSLTLSGPARKMSVSYRSDPPLQFNQLVTLIAVGRMPMTDPVLASQQALEQQSIIQTGANTVLSQAISQGVSTRLRRFFGVSRLKVDPQIGGAEANPSARISTEQQITGNLTLSYSYDLSSVQQQVVRVEYAPNRRWSIIVTRDANGLVGTDFLYKKRLR